MTRIINCIATPRNVSTALMYSWAQRRDTRVLDEPFYAHYLSQRPVNHPGRDEILASQPTDYEEVFRNIAGVRSEVLYVKNMAHHMRLIPLHRFRHFRTVFLIRNPKQLIASFAKVIDNVAMPDIGLADQVAQYRYLEERGARPEVVDAGILLAEPREVLAQLCARLGVPFMEDMLRWTPGPRPEDGVWAKYWYANVHKSDGFAEQPTSSRPFPPEYTALLSEAMMHYEFLFSHAIKP